MPDVASLVKVAVLTGVTLTLCSLSVPPERPRVLAAPALARFVPATVKEVPPVSAALMPLGSFRRLVIASGLYRLLGRRMRGYGDSQARQIFRNLIDLPADVSITDREILARFHRRAHLPMISASGLLDQVVEVPWWQGLPLRMTT